VGARYSARVHTGSCAHPASYTVGTCSFPGVKRPGRGVDHPPPSSAKVKEIVQLISLLALWAFVACFRVNFTFTFTFVRHTLKASTSDIRTLPVVDSSKIFQEVFYFETSTISSSLRSRPSTFSGSYRKFRSGQ
jgi:hypothetical protein